jgi:hypothetical protein
MSYVLNYEWSQGINHHTLLKLMNDEAGNFIDVNCVEYAGILVIIAVTESFPGP